MTLKKSMLSVAAAGAIAAMLTGCGGSGSSSSSSSTSSVTSVTATDGYVLNYTVTATYSDGNESNRSYATTAILANAVTDAKIVAGATQTAGSAVMNLATDLTAAQITNLQSVTLSAKAQASDGTTLTYATFFDANGDSKFVAVDGDVLAPTAFSMTAPVGYAVITPITTIIQSRIATIQASDTNDSNKTAQMALALTQIATGLGLTESDLKSVDPINAVSTNPTYALVNAMLGQIITDGEVSAVATALAAITTAPTTASAALTNIAGGATQSKTFFTSAADQLTNDSSMLATVSTWNLDALRSSTAGQTAFSPALLAVSSADFNVTSITIGNANVSTLTGAGAKANFSALDDTQLVFAASNDTNVTNKSLKLAIKVSAQETHIADDANISSLTILIPYDINNTIGASEVINGAVSGTVTWEGVKADGSTFTGDMNKSTFSAAASGVLNGLAFASGTLTAKIGSIITAIDTNSSSMAGIVDNNISSVSVALVDTSSVLAKSTGTKTEYWGNTAVASVAGGINVTGKTIIKNTLVDGRIDGAVAAANVVPNSGLAFTAPLVGDVTTESSGSIMRVNNGTTLAIAVAASTTDANEKNSTITITAGGASIFDLNTTQLIKTYKSAGTVAATAGNDVNTTSTTVGDINGTLTTVVTDEFGDANTTVYTFLVNRAPYSIEANATRLVTANTVVPSSTSGDLNITLRLGHDLADVTADNNLTFNGAADVNISDGNLTNVKFTLNDYDEYNKTGGSILFKSAICGGGFTSTVHPNGTNLGIKIGAAGETNETNLSFVSTGSADTFYLAITNDKIIKDTVVAGFPDCNVTVTGADAYDLNSTDFNLTINIRN